MTYATRDAALRALRHMPKTERFYFIPVLEDGKWALERQSKITSRSNRGWRYVLAATPFNLDAYASKV